MSVTPIGPKAGVTTPQLLCRASQPGPQIIRPLVNPRAASDADAATDAEEKTGKGQGKEMGRCALLMACCACPPRLPGALEIMVRLNKGRIVSLKANSGAGRGVDAR